MLQVEWEVVLFFAVGLLLLYGLGWLLLVPLRRLGWFFLNSLLGIFALYLLRRFGQGLGLVAAINPFSALLTGFLGLPGLCLTLLIQNLL